MPYMDVRETVKTIEASIDKRKGKKEQEVALTIIKKLKRKYSYQDIADYFEVDWRSVYNWHKGIYKISKDKAEQIIRKAT